MPNAISCFAARGRGFLWTNEKHISADNSTALQNYIIFHCHLCSVTCFGIARYVSSTLLLLASYCTPIICITCVWMCALWACSVHLCGCRCHLHARPCVSVTWMWRLPLCRCSCYEFVCICTYVYCNTALGFYLFKVVVSQTKLTCFPPSILATKPTRARRHLSDVLCPHPFKKTWRRWFNSVTAEPYEPGFSNILFCT